LVVTDVEATLAVEAAKELVKALVAGGVEVAQKVPALWRRLTGKQQQRREQVEASASELAAAGGAELTVARQEAVWQERFTDLLAEHPDVADEVKALVAELRQVVQAVDGGVVQQVHAGRDAYTAGRDMNFGTRSTD
jgi:ABC-type nitrate/sulfonate/bicarbonate transport system substrate-binding protein